MNKLVLFAALAFSSAAFAAPAKNPASTGQFRRAEAIVAAGAVAKTAKVVSLTTANHRDVTQTAQPKDARVLLVQDGGKVTLVNAPLDRSAKVTKLSARSANAMGLVTQGQARRLASRNTGEYGTKGRVTVANDGLGAKRGSYLFKQVAPATVTIKNYDGKPAQVANIYRTVSVSGKGESVSGTPSTVAAK